MTDMRKWNGTNFFHDEDEVFTSMEEAKIHAGWLKKNYRHISSTKITKRPEGTYWVWHH